MESVRTYKTKAAVTLATVCVMSKASSLSPNLELHQRLRLRPPPLAVERQGLVEVVLDLVQAAVEDDGVLCVVGGSGGGDWWMNRNTCS